MLDELVLGALHEPLTGRRQGGEACLAQAVRQAAILRGQGLAEGDRVLVHYSNTIEYFVDLLAIWLAGGCCIPLDGRLPALEIEVLARAARPRMSLWLGKPDPASSALLEALGVSVLSRPDPLSGSSQAVAAELPATDDHALILFTSGTTGQPKGVVHTHRSLQDRWTRQRERLGTDSLERTLCMLPTNFAWGLIGNALYAWLSGQTLFLLPAFRSDVLLQVSKICDDHEITYLPSVPAMWRLAVRMVAPPTRGTLRRVACGTSALPASLWRDIQRWSGVADVLHVYSMTECGVLAMQSGAEAAPEEGLVGRPFDGVDIKIVPLGTPTENVPITASCSEGESGLICARTSGLMQGYFERPDLTATALVDGWFLTGDIGCQDAAGRIYLRGREKEMINVGGVKVYPGDVDSVLQRAAAVDDVCTFGAADPLQGEQVAVAVVLKDGSGDQLGTIQVWAEERLASFQLPKRWYVLDAIPRTSRGKLNRDEVAKACTKVRAVDPRRSSPAGSTGRGA